MEDNQPTDNAVIFYPAGGAFNKLRPQQVFLEQLLDEHCIGYSKTPQKNKRDYVYQNVLLRIQESGRVLKLFQGAHPDDGGLVVPKEDEALERISQKLRDTKKRKLRRQPRLAASILREKRKNRAKSPRVKATSAAGTAAAVVSHSKAAVAAEKENESDANFEYEDEEEEAGKGTSPLVTATPFIERAKLTPFATRIALFRTRLVSDVERDNELLTRRQLKDIIWGQWDHIDTWRRVCERQTETIATQARVIGHQHQLLAGLGLHGLNNPYEDGVVVDHTAPSY